MSYEEDYFFLSIAFPLQAKESITHPSAVVLVYHHVSDKTPTSTSISPKLFQEQIQYLQKSGFTVWGLDKIASYVERKKVFPPKIIGISFDDGFISIYETAWPLLRKYKTPFTIFVSTKFIGDHSGTYLSWKQLIEMSDSGVLIGNHTHSHNKIKFSFDGNDQSKYYDEFFGDIAKAQVILGEKLKKSPQLFAYPYGEFSLAMKKDLFEQKKLWGYSQLSGPIGEYSDIAALPRFPMNNHYGKMDDFKKKVSMLQLPVVQYEPSGTVKAVKDFTLIGTLKGNTVPVEKVQCFTSAGDKLKVHIHSSQKNTFLVNSGKISNKGRFKINCTAQYQSQTYWYSFFWILI